MKTFLSLFILLLFVLIPDLHARPRISIGISVPFCAPYSPYTYCAPPCYYYPPAPIYYTNPQPITIIPPARAIVTPVYSYPGPCAAEIPRISRTPQFETPVAYPGSNPVVAAVQGALARLNYYHGVIDGLSGNMTICAIKAYQFDRSLPITGSVDAALIRDLRL